MSYFTVFVFVFIRIIEIILKAGLHLGAWLQFFCELIVVVKTSKDIENRFVFLK